MNILLTSVGRRSYLVNYFKEALGADGKVHVANSSEISPAFSVADNAVVTPMIYDENYISFLINYCQTNKIKAIIPLFDIDLPILSINKKKFEEVGTTVIVSDFNVIDKCNDKWESFNYLNKNGFYTPKTFLIYKDALKALENNEISYPLMIKPRWGMGSIAIFEAENEEELRVFYNKTKRNILNTYLKYESKEDIEKSVIIQEKICGQEYGLDVINDLYGKYMTTIAKKKYAMRSGETDCAITVDDNMLIKNGEKLGKKMKHIANLDVDVFIENDKVYILEMNARFGGGYPFSHITGVNLPKAIIKWLKGEKVETNILTAKINLMAQKDINIVRIYPYNRFSIEKTNDESELFYTLNSLESQLEPTLVQRGIDLCKYSKKLSKKSLNLQLKDEDNKIVGFLSAYINDHISQTAYISLLIIDKEFRGLDLAKKLIVKFEEIARENHMNLIKLEVRKNNENAIDFYKHLGFSFLYDNGKDSMYMGKNIINGGFSNVK